jgi:Ner family transcriptional regulator
MDRELTQNKKHLKAWVLYQLQIRGLSFAEVARRNGNARRDLPRMAFDVPYPKWEKIVAAAIDMKPEELWPERYAKRAANEKSKAYRKAESTRKCEVMQ